MDITTSMTIIATILLACAFGSINALFSYFLDFCFWEGNVFGKWLPFIAKLNLKWFRPKLLETLKEAKKNKNPEYDNMLVELASKESLALFKVAGGCIVCLNVWIGFGSYVLIHAFTPLGWLYAIPYLLFSSFLLRKLTKV